MSKLSKVKNAFYIVAILLLVLICALIALTTFSHNFGPRFLVVSSGSMHPALKLGSVIGIAPSENYKVGDVVTYKPLNQLNTNNSKITTTHRILKVEQTGGVTYYKTKGDANEVADFGKIKKEQVVGKVFVHIPYLGIFTNFLKSQLGFILFIIIPVTLIIYTELINIKNEAKRLLSEKRTRKLNWLERGELAVGSELLELERDVVTDALKNKRRPI